jgi:hypothetical protein
MAATSRSVLVYIQTDPLKSHRAVEALRIALGLGSHNEGRDLQIILAGRAPYLLSEDTSTVVDGEILEKHLPVFVEWETVFVIATTAECPAEMRSDVKTSVLSPDQVQAMVQSADRTFIF